MVKFFRREEGASAVEFAIIAPLLFMLVFGIISFGIAFMQLQTVRGAVREGARASAVGASASQVQTQVMNSAAGGIPTGTTVDLSKATCSSGVGSDTIVALAWNGQSINVTIPFFPTIHLSPPISATFRCELTTP